MNDLCMQEQANAREFQSSKKHKTEIKVTDNVISHVVEITWHNC